MPFSRDGGSIVLTINHMIDINKKYKCRNGQKARVLCVDRPHSEFTVVSMNEESGVIRAHLKDGRLFQRGINDYDLIPLSEKDNFISYLEETLIPDLKASGMENIAKDFETCIEYMKES